MTTLSTVRAERGKPFASLRTALAATALMMATSPLAAACLDAGAQPAITAASYSSVDRAHAMRVLQSEMMVAGLSCGAKPHYNAFATKYKAVLIKNGDRLKKHYYAEHGSTAGFKKLNTFVTRLANEASVRIAMTGPGYCQMAMERFEVLLAAPVDSLELYSTAHAIELGMMPTTPVVIQASAAGDGCDNPDDKIALTEE